MDRRECLVNVVYVQVKCDQYWPNRGTEIYGLVQVTITDVLELATFTLRTFHISLVNNLGSVIMIL